MEEVCYYPKGASAQRNRVALLISMRLPACLQLWFNDEIGLAQFLTMGDGILCAK